MRRIPLVGGRLARRRVDTIHMDNDVSEDSNSPIMDLHQYTQHLQALVSVYLCCKVDNDEMIPRDVFVAANCWAFRLTQNPMNISELAGDSSR